MLLILILSSVSVSLKRTIEKQKYSNNVPSWSLSSLSANVLSERRVLTDLECLMKNAQLKPEIKLKFTNYPQVEKGE